MNLDVTLSESATIAGTLTNAGGQPVASAQVRLASVGAPVTRIASTDAQGRYRFDHVVLMPFRVQGCESTGLRLCAADGAALTSAGATVNLAIGVPGSINGTVFANSSGTVVASPNVTLLNRDYSGPFYQDGFSRTVFGAPDGTYSSNSLPAGNWTAMASDFKTGRAGIATGTLTPGGTSTIDVTLGNATTFVRALDGSTNNFRYDIECDGSLWRGGQPALGTRAFSGGASFLALFPGTASTGATAFFPCLDAAPLEMNGRGVALDGGRLDVVGLEISRKIFVPESAEFGRYLEVLTNRTAVDLTVRVSVTGTLAMASAATSLAVRPSDTGNTVAVFQDATETASSAGFVFAGAGASVPAIPIRVEALAPNYKYEWIVTVPAGQTRSVLHFVTQGEASAATAVANQSFALANLSDPAALVGLRAAEKSSIVNFIVP